MDFYQLIWVFLSRFRHRYLFRHFSNFGTVILSEKVTEVVPSLPFAFLVRVMLDCACFHR